jgi:hypothetical protein
LSTLATRLHVLALALIAAAAAGIAVGARTFGHHGSTPVSATQRQLMVGAVLEQRPGSTILDVRCSAGQGGSATCTMVVRPPKSSQCEKWQAELASGGASEPPLQEGEAAC